MAEQKTESSIQCAVKHKGLCNHSVATTARGTEKETNMSILVWQDFTSFNSLISNKHSSFLSEHTYKVSENVQWLQFFTLS